jgi:thiol peroxidase
LFFFLICTKNGAIERGAMLPEHSRKDWSDDMATITFKGNQIQTNGELPEVGSKAPSFVLTDTGLADRTLADYAGKTKIITANPSLDTGVCQATARAFNQKVAELDDAVVLVVTSDLPFAQKRFCTAEGLDKVVPLSIMRNRDFAEKYGLLMTDGPLAGLVARAVVVIDGNDKVVYRELVPEVTTEPNYDSALAAARAR